MVLQLYPKQSGPLEVWSLLTLWRPSRESMWFYSKNVRKGTKICQDNNLKKKWLCWEPCVSRCTRWPRLSPRALVFTEGFSGTLPGPVLSAWDQVLAKRGISLVLIMTVQSQEAKAKGALGWSLHCSRRACAMRLCEHAGCPGPGRPPACSESSALWGSGQVLQDSSSCRRTLGKAGA